MLTIRRPLRRLPLLPPATFRTSRATRLQHRCLQQQPPAEPARAAADTSQNVAKIARWSARLAHDNTFLSYHRNAIIATVAGCALIRYRKDEDKPPLDGVGLLAMGGLYIYVGSGLYIWQTLKLATPLKLGTFQLGWSIFNALWPLALWTISLMCLVDEVPIWLLEVLRRAEPMLPRALRASLFLDPPALYPVCRLLASLKQQEEARLKAVRAHAHNVAVGGPLSRSDVATIIERRLDRLGVLQTSLDELARSPRTVPTALAAPLLDTLNMEAMLLEKVLEIDLLQGDQNYVVWRAATAFSSDLRRLRDELEAVRALLRRIKAVKKLGSVGYVALASSGTVTAKKRQQIFDNAYDSDIDS